MSNWNTSTTALLVIDTQKAFAELEAAGNRRNNPDAMRNIVRLLQAFRRTGAAIFHVRHSCTSIGSNFRPDRPGYEVIDEA